MSIIRSTGAFIGTNESTGITLTNGSNTTSAEIDLLGDDLSAGEINLYLVFTSTVTAGTVDVKLFADRTTGNQYLTGLPLVVSIAPFSGTSLVWVNGPTMRFPVARRMLVNVFNNTTGASLTNLFVGYELFKFS